MPLTQTLPAPLIADSDNAFLHSIKCHSQASVLPPILVHNDKEMELEIQHQPCSAVFINPDLAEPMGAPLVRVVLKYSPGTPIFFILDSSRKEPAQEDLESFMVQKVLRKPLSYSTVLSFIQSQLTSFKADDALHAAEKNKDKLNSETSALDLQFIPILARNFVSGNVSFFDLYVRLGTDRYVKILQAKESFTPDRLACYLAKGVVHFYIRKEAQEYYLRYCENLATKLLKSKTASVEVKTAATLNFGQEVASAFKSFGVSESSVAHATQFARATHQLIEELRPTDKSLLSKFMGDLLRYEHGVRTSMIASLLLAPLDIKTDKSVQVVGLACLLHDIGLLGMDPKFGVEDEAELTPEELKLYWSHPEVGAALLKAIPTVEPIVIQAVEQHHERRDRKGYPKRPPGNLINRVAEIVGISDDFDRFLVKAKTNPTFDPLKAIVHHFDGFSPVVVDAFRIAFMKAVRQG